MSNDGLPVYLFEMRQFMGGTELVFTTLVRSREEAAAAAFEHLVDGELNVVWKLLPVDSVKVDGQKARQCETLGPDTM
ncbi:hypothetical protein [Desulfatiglans anilini]|uniref:hypothetical protein n=1 Tax=Desulfatiglans anilini TaxID=90728 RepID=UPI00040E0AF7|nr:hypothetical protein [Desulfatiglans anilini]